MDTKTSLLDRDQTQNHDGVTVRKAPSTPATISKQRSTLWKQNLTLSKESFDL